MRIEILGINEALIQQRIHALGSRSKIKVKLYEVKSDPVRAAELEKDMQAIRDSIAENEAEIAKYSGGLIKVTLMSGSATMQSTLAMLQNEHLKAKYGIYWVPTAANTSASTAAITTPKPKKSINVVPADNPILVPTITNKQFKQDDYEDSIWFDIEWNTDNLKKPTRAVKDKLTFADLFGEAHFVIGKTITDQMSPAVPLIETGIGFDYNQFKDSHNWMLQTDVKDMTFKFTVESIIYADGTKETL